MKRNKIANEQHHSFFLVYNRKILKLNDGNTFALSN